jgi:hypothetical protein
VKNFWTKVAILAAVAAVLLALPGGSILVALRRKKIYKALRD